MTQYNLTSTPNDPKFNGQTIFNSLDYNGNSYCEGVCFVEDYNQIVQNIHFEGEVGDFRLFHGYADRPWRFEGYISCDNAVWATAYANLATILQGIETQIDSATPYTLIDSMGNYWHNAEVRKLHYNSFPQKTSSGWMVHVTVTGVIHNSDTQEGQTS